MDSNKKWWKKFLGKFGGEQNLNLNIRISVNGLKTIRSSKQNYKTLGKYVPHSFPSQFFFLEKSKLQTKPKERNNSQKGELSISINSKPANFVWLTVSLTKKKGKKIYHLE